jgi:hypothetical protein
MERLHESLAAKGVGAIRMRSLSPSPSPSPRLRTDILLSPCLLQLLLLLSSPTRVLVPATNVPMFSNEGGPRRSLQSEIDTAQSTQCTSTEPKYELPYSVTPCCVNQNTCGVPL